MRRTDLPGARPGEGRLIAHVAGTFALIEGARGLGEVGADTLVTGGPDGASVLPPLFVALGVAGMAATLAYAAAVTRARGDRFFASLVLGIGAIVALSWSVAATAGPAATSTLWIVVMTAGSLLMTISWTVAGRAFHARQARRVFPLCASAAIAGSFVGQILSGPVAHALGALQLVLLEALLLIAAAAVLAGIGPALRSVTPAHSSVRRALAEGASSVARTPLLRLIAVAYVLFAVLMVGVSFGFLREARTAFPDEAERATALGLFSALVTATAFVVSTVVARRLTARIGVTATALSLPLVYLGGFLIWAVQLSFVTAAGVRFAQVVTQRGLSNAAWGSFFSVVPGHRRAQVMAVIDGVPGQAGTILTGVVLMVGLAGGREVFLGAALVAAVCLVVVVRIRRAYVAAVVATLRDGVAVRVLAGGPDLATIVADPAVIDGLLADVASPDPGRRRVVAGLLGGTLDPRAVAAVHDLAADQDPAVRAAAFRAMPVGVATPGIVLAGVADPDPAVAAAAIAAAGWHAATAGTLAATPGTLDTTGDPGWASVREAVLRRIDDPEPAVRAAAAAALAGSTDASVASAAVRDLLAADDPAARVAAVSVLARHRDLLPDGPAHLHGLLDDPDERVRVAAARAIVEAPDGPGALVTTVVAGTSPARTAALAALAQGPDLGPLDRERLLAWTAGMVRRTASLATAAASMRTAMPQAADPALRAEAGASVAAWEPGFLDAASGLLRVLESRARAAGAELLAALRAVCPPEVGDAIARSLASTDAETRAQAIEALEVAVGGPVARQVAAVLDEAPATARPRTVAACAQELADDPDPWVRTLASRTLALSAPPAGARGDHRVPNGRADRSASGDRADQQEAPMASDGLASSELVDRMLLLGRVPLFASLAPEDLARIADTATAAAYGPDELLIAEGDTSDHLIVIVAGTIRVVTGATGAERVVRRCGPGEHIGELAMLRRAPRAASVVAEPPGVRALLLDADGLRSVLRARPDAALAMLATLAERIGGSDR